MAETITSRGNQLFKLARSLRERKERDRTGLFLIEGILHVGEAAEAGLDLFRYLTHGLRRGLRSFARCARSAFPIAR